MTTETKTFTVTTKTQNDYKEMLNDDKETQKYAQGTRNDYKRHKRRC